MCKVKSSYFSLHLKILFALGIDLYNIKNKMLKFVYNIYSFLLVIFTVYVFFIIEGMDFVLNYTDFAAMTFSLCYFVIHVSGGLKVTLFLIQSKTFTRLLEKIETGVFKPNVNRGGTDEFRIINDAIRICDRQGCFFYLMVFFIIGLRSVYAATSPGLNDEIYDAITNSTIISHTSVLPFFTWFPFDRNVRPYYDIAFIYQVYCTVIYGLYIGAIDAVIYGFIIQIKAQFLIVVKSLENVIERGMKIVSPELDVNRIYDASYDKITLPKGIVKYKRLSIEVQKEIEKLVVEIVKHHQHLIEFSDEIEEAFRYVMLIEFLSSIYILCFQLFQLSLTDPASAQFISMCLYLILKMFQIMCFCWHGNEVIEVSSDIPKVIFGIDWVDFNESTKKALLMIMMRAQKPTKFTTGKFALLSLQTYMTIVRGSGSYFMVLRQMNN